MPGSVENRKNERAWHRSGCSQEWLSCPVQLHKPSSMFQRIPVIWWRPQPVSMMCTEQAACHVTAAAHENKPTMWTCSYTGNKQATHADCLQIHMTVGQANMDTD